MRIFTILIMLMSFFVLAEGPANSLSRESILRYLPQEIREISRPNSYSEIEKSFKAKIIRKTKGTIHLAYFSKSNDVTVGFKDGQFDYLFIEVPKEIQDQSTGLFSRVIVSLTEKEKQKTLLAQKSGTHDSGRYFTIDLPKFSLKLSFYNNERKDLRSITVKPGK